MPPTAGPADLPTTWNVSVASSALEVRRMRATDVLFVVVGLQFTLSEQVPNFTTVAPTQVLLTIWKSPGVSSARALLPVCSAAAVIDSGPSPLLVTVMVLP